MDVGIGLPEKKVTTLFFANSSLPLRFHVKHLSISIRHTFPSLRTVNNFGSKSGHLSKFNYLECFKVKNSNSQTRLSKIIKYC